MKRISALALGVAFSTSGFAFPLFPEIIGHDINFGAFNAPGPIEWAQNGLAPDTLFFSPDEMHHEATGYWPVWPAPPVLPIFGGGGIFGGDVVLGVQFDGQDASYVGAGGVIDVSLTGTGAIGGAPDLMIFGSIGAPGPVMLLWALELEDVSLYGLSGRSSYVLEGMGRIVGGAIAEQNNLIGQNGAMRGHLDFIDAPLGWIPSEYHPLMDPGQQQIRAAYSAETGLAPVPEPASLAVMGIALVGFITKRRRK